MRNSAPSVRPLISVIVPLYNKGPYIERTLCSVLKQTYAEWEAVVVDDGSTDDGVARVEALNDSRIRLVRKANGGVSSARNHGLKFAKGAYILYLDADDVLQPGCLETLWRLVERYGVEVAAGNLYCEQGGMVRPFSFYPYEGVLGDNFRAMTLMDTVLRTGNFLVRTDLARKYVWNETLNRYEDYEYLVRLLKNTSVAYTPLPVMIYMLDNLGLSLRQDKWENDYFAHLPARGETFWERMLYGYIYTEALLYYPSRRDWITTHYAAYAPYGCLWRWLRIPLRWRHSWHKFLYRRRYGV